MAADPQQTAADLGGAPASTDTDAAVARASKAVPVPTGKAAVSADAAKARSMADAQAKDFEAFHRENPLPKQPDLAPFTQKMPEADPMRQFGSLASGLAILAGALTRTPLTTALNASAEAMKAIRTGDLMAYQDAKDRWKDNTDLAIKNAEWAQKGYDNAFALMKEKHAEGWAALQTVAAMDGNVAALNQQDVRLAMEQNNASIRNRIALDEHRERMDEFAAKQEERAIDRAAVEARVRDKFDALGLDADARKNLPESLTSQVRFQARNEVIAEKKQAEMSGSGGVQQFDLSAARALALKENPNLASLPPDERNLAIYRAGSKLQAERFGAKATAQAEGRLAGYENPFALEDVAPNSGGLTRDALDRAATSMLLNGKPPTLARGPMAGQQQTAIQNRAAEMATSLKMTPEQVSALPAERKASAGALIQDVRFEDGVKQGLFQFERMFPIAEEYAKRLDLTEVRTINSAILAGQTEFGSADANNYANAMATIALEYGRITAGPTSNAMAPVEMMKIGMTRLGPNITPEQFAGEKELIKRESKAKLDGISQAINERRAFLSAPLDRQPAPALPPVVTPAPALPPVVAPAPAPPEGAKTVTPKGVRAVWRNGRWVEDDGR